MLASFYAAMGETAKELLTGINDRSLGGPPPIDSGALRGNADVYQFNINGPIFTWDSKYSAPSFTAPHGSVVIVFNQPYADIMHNTVWNPGPRSLKEGGVPSYLERHIPDYDFFKKVASKMRRVYK